jgi:hypothetical protein
LDNDWKTRRSHIYSAQHNCSYYRPTITVSGNFGRKCTISRTPEIGVSRRTWFIKFATAWCHDREPFPLSSAWAIGILLGITLFFSGRPVLMFGLAAKAMAKEAAGAVWFRLSREKIVPKLIKFRER